MQRVPKGRGGRAEDQCSPARVSTINPGSSQALGVADDMGFEVQQPQKVQLCGFLDFQPCLHPRISIQLLSNALGSYLLWPSDAWQNGDPLWLAV